MVEVKPLTRRECALYNMGAYEMLMSKTKGKSEKAMNYMFSMIIEFLHAYLPDYSNKDIKNLMHLCMEEKDNGTARKLFNKHHERVMGGEFE